MTPSRYLRSIEKLKKGQGAREPLSISSFTPFSNYVGTLPNSIATFNSSKASRQNVFSILLRLFEALSACASPSITRASSKPPRPGPSFPQMALHPPEMLPPSST